LRLAYEQGNAALQAAILRASRQVDLQLGQEPQRQGESRGGRTRILFRAPVAVLFEVDEARKLVRIVRSWAYCPVRDKDGLAG
jgi:hypothetical protein